MVSLVLGGGERLELGRLRSLSLALIAARALAMTLTTMRCVSLGMQREWKAGRTLSLLARGTQKPLARALEARIRSRCSRQPSLHSSHRHFSGRYAWQRKANPRRTRRCWE